MKAAAKKQRGYHYQNQWEKLYLCVKVGDETSCLLCKQTFSYTKAANIKRHYYSQHALFDKKFPLESEERLAEINNMKENLGLEEASLPLCNDNPTVGSLISYRVAYLLAKHKKPLADGETFRELFSEVMKDMFTNTELEKRVTTFNDNLALSRRTISRRVQSIGSNLRSQLMEDLARCEYFSFQVDESPNNANCIQVLVFFRLVFPDFGVREELFTTFSLKKPATAADMFKTLNDEFSSAGVPLDKLAAITTDGTAIMKDSKTGFIAKCKNHSCFPKFNSFHCALQQLTLCCKELTFEGVVDIVMNIVNSIIAKPLASRIYKVFKAENNSDAPGLLCVAEMKWLSKVTIFEKFLDNLNDIKEFLKTRGTEYSQLSDSQWINELAYIIDLAHVVRHYVSEMQGNSKFFCKNVETLESLKLFFRSVTEIFSQNSVPFEFKRLQKNVNESKDNSFDGEYFSNFSQVLYNHMSKRFTDISETQQIYNFLVNPKGNNMSSHNISSLIIKSHPVDASELPFEINRLQCDTKLAGIMATGGDIWPIIAEAKSYPNLLIVYKRISSFFATTYLCQMGFSHVNQIKSTERAVLSDRRLLDSMLISLSNYEPQLENLSKAMDI